MKVLVLQHGDAIPPGHLGDVLVDAGAEVATVHLDHGEALPDIGGWDAIVVLGGEMGAYDTDRFGWLADEKRFLAEAVAAGIPTLGVCLGCQLLADALGGRAYLAEAPEIGALVVARTPAGEQDPVVRHLDSPVVVWHQDTWDPPPGATLLARTDRYPHAFRLGSALGLQPHPEASPEIVDGWIETVGADMVPAAGIDPDRLRAQVAVSAAGQRDMAHRLFGAWVSELGQ